MAISKRLRFEVLQRDGHRCRYCGLGTAHVVLHVDHITPKALGGTDDLDNLAAACADCNAGKSSIAPTTGVVEDARQIGLDWTAALAQAASEVENESDELVEAFHEWWPSYYTVTPDMEESVRRFHRDGLTRTLMLSASAAALGARHVKGGTAKFRYFAAICQSRIREIQSRAAEILQDDR